MPKDPSFDYYLDQEIEERMKDEPDCDECNNKGCFFCSRPGDYDPYVTNNNGGTWEEMPDDKPWGQK